MTEYRRPIRSVAVVEHSLSVSDDRLCFSFHFDSFHVASGEVSYLWSGRNAFITRILIECGWLSETMEEQFEQSVSIVFSDDRRRMEIVYKRLSPVNWARFLKMRKLEAEETESKNAETC